MKIDVIRCDICGADVTRSMKFYPNGIRGGRFCYDCYEKWGKVQKKRKKRKDHKVTRNGVI